MSQAIKDYVKFNVLGLEDTNVSLEDEMLLKVLTARKKLYEENQDKGYLIELYSLENQVKIFNELKKRQGNSARITFMNSSDKPVEIVKARIVKGKILLNCVFCKYRKEFSMWLDTFLNDYSAEKIKKIKPEKFEEVYLVSVVKALSQTEQKLKDLEEKYNNIYNETKRLLEAEYDAELAKYNKIEKEAKSHRYQMSDDEALESAKSFKGLEKTKDYWNSKISIEEKDVLMKWISENIYSIRVYGLTGGQSGNTLLNEYSDVGEIKYREVKRNSSGKVISQDSIVAHISFKTLENVPVEIFKKIVSTKGRNENLFYGNRLNDKNLALFLLSEYHDKGFKAGIRNLYKEVVL